MCGNPKVTNLSAIQSSQFFVLGGHKSGAVWNSGTASGWRQERQLRQERRQALVAQMNVHLHKMTDLRSVIDYYTDDELNRSLGLRVRVGID